MRSHNPAYGLWNDGEDEVKSSKKYGARALDTSVEEADRANRGTNASPIMPIRSFSRRESSERWMNKSGYVIST